MVKAEDRVHSSEPSTSSRTGAPGPSAWPVLSLLAASQLVSLVGCGASEANESISTDSFTDLIEWLQSLGPAGPLFFVLVVSLCELIPLFPTQPLSLAGGLLFDGGLGTVLVWSAQVTAATLAFLIARGAGRKFAQKMVRRERRFSAGI